VCVGALFADSPAAKVNTVKVLSKALHKVGWRAHASGVQGAPLRSAGLLWAALCWRRVRRGPLAGPGTALTLAGACGCRARACPCSRCCQLRDDWKNDKGAILDEVRLMQDVADATRREIHDHFEKLHMVRPHSLRRSFEWPWFARVLALF